MKKKMLFLRIVVIVIVALETLVLAGGVIVNNAVDINNSYDAIKAAYVINHIPLNNFLFSNNEIAFIYDAINNKISEYPKTVPDFINLPIDILIDAIDMDERIHIAYADDDNYENDIIIAQAPEAGALWEDGVIVTLTVNRRYSDIISKFGYMSESLGNLYLLSKTDIVNKKRGVILSNGKKLVDNEMIKLYVNNGNVYYNDRSGVYKLSTEGASQVLEKQIYSYAVIDEKIYYTDKEDGKLYCYNMTDKATSLVIDEQIIFFYVNSDYIVCHNPHDIFILDHKSFTMIKNMHYENFITGCSLDNDNVYILEMEYIGIGEQKSKITKYNIKQDELTDIFNANEMVSTLLAIEDKIIFSHYTADNQLVFQYINMRNMENKVYTVDVDIHDAEAGIADILFDGQKIIYKTEGQAFYSICIFTGKIKKIELIN